MFYNEFNLNNVSQRLSQAKFGCQPLQADWDFCQKWLSKLNMAGSGASRASTSHLFWANTIKIQNKTLTTQHLGLQNDPQK